jgi:hypothetical protein
MKILYFPTKLCSRCDKIATKSIQLIDEFNNSYDKKYFCETHFENVKNA